MQIALLCHSPAREKELDEIAFRWGLKHQEHAQFALVLTETHLALHKMDEPKLGAVFVDWVGGAVGHRRKYGGGKGQSIAKAIGLNKGVIPSVIDATAGLGRDAFVLASLGCRVQMIERHPVVAALLEDGLCRAKRDPEIGAWVSDRMSLLYASSLTALAEKKIAQPDVVYLDPMYPHKKKSALVKKEMRVFQALVGADGDANDLLTPALAVAKKRVVVKRPDYAEHLNHHVPLMQIMTKKNRFDVYVNAAMK